MIEGWEKVAIGPLPRQLEDPVQQEQV